MVAVTAGLMAECWVLSWAVEKAYYWAERWAVAMVEQWAVH